jgi:hypothetical protein
MQELIEASAAFCDVHFEDGAVDRCVVAFDLQTASQVRSSPSKFSSFAADFAAMPAALLTTPPPLKSLSTGEEMEMYLEFSLGNFSQPLTTSATQIRNGFYWKMSEKARSEGKSDPTPLHGDLLREIGAV